MPRLPPRLLHCARKIDPLLPLVLQGTRDVASAKNELRWLRESVLNQQQQQQKKNRRDGHWTAPQYLRRLCIDRARGKPLQYILGTEYFGDLEITCEPGVLIPRQETAASVTHLVQSLHQGNTLPEHLRVLDLCTGTGCIPLLVNYEFTQTHGRKAGLEVVGIDISSKAFSLAQRNLHRLLQDGILRLVSPSSSLKFLRADVLAEKIEETTPLPLATALQEYGKGSPCEAIAKGRWDILISNPPYISPDAFKYTTTRSVKRFEPKLALVPKELDALAQPKIDPGDIFYPRLLEIAKQVDAQVILYEVADLGQACRVAAMAQAQGIWSSIEIWRDDPTQNDEEGNLEDVFIPNGVKVIGSGNGRSVFAYRGEANAWLRKVDS